MATSRDCVQLLDSTVYDLAIYSFISSLIYYENSAVLESDRANDDVLKKFSDFVTEAFS